MHTWGLECLFCASEAAFLVKLSASPRINGYLSPSILSDLVPRQKSPIHDFSSATGTLGDDELQPTFLCG